MKANARHRYCQAHRLAAVVLLATACGFTGTLANAQSDDLIAAAGRGDLPLVNARLKSGADVNDAKYMPGPTTALMAASANGHLAVVQALLAAKADVNAKRALGTKDGDTALTLAERNRHVEVVQALLAAKADVDAGGRPALYGATRVGDLYMVRVLLAAKPDLNWREPITGETTLMHALSTGHWDVARLLVEAGANVNAMTKAGATALTLVAGESSPRSLAMVQALLAAHADVNGGPAGRSTGVLSPSSPSYARAAGYTALGLAASTGSVEVVQALLAANSWVDVNAKQRDGKTPLTIASAKGRADVVRLLLAAKADVTAADNDGKTALMFASANGHLEVVQALLAAKAEVNTKQHDGSTALMLALQNDHPEAARLLTSAGAK